MTVLDWVIVSVYLAYIVYDGTKRSKETDTVQGYFLANRTLPWWAVGLSVMATQMSAITLVGTTGQGFADGMRFVQFYFGLPLAMIILCLTAVPFFYRAKIYTAYEYLEKRFDSKTRSLTSFFFLLSRGLSCGVIIAAPAVILSIVLHWNLEITVLAIGIPTVIYTMIGGVQAVTWTDVKQMVLILIGMTVCVLVIIYRLPESVSTFDALRVAGASDRLTTIDFDFDLSETYTFWSGLLGGMFLMLSYFGCDQSQVQRYLTARSIDQGRISLLVSAFIKIPIQFVILLIGVLVFAFYQFQPAPLLFHAEKRSELERGSYSQQFRDLQAQHDRAGIRLNQTALAFAENEDSPQALENYREALSQANQIRSAGLQLAGRSEGTGPFNEVNFVFPSFVLNELPIGLVGLMIAAIFAAAMSSISSELNALSTASIMDFYRRHFKKEASDAHYLRVSKLATAFWGLMACGVAVYAAQLGSLIEVVNKFGSFFYGSLLGVFALAVAARWCTPNGAFIGLLGGMTIVAITSLSTDISFLWYNVVGVLAVVATAVLVSFMEKLLRGIA